MSGNEPNEPSINFVMKESDPSSSLEAISFSSLVLSLASSALVYMGEIVDPVSQKKEGHPLLAKQNIDILDMLQVKTKGNLSREEQDMLTSILYDLRMKYLAFMNPASAAPQGK